MIEELFVGEKYRRQGIATRLFDQIKKTFGDDVQMRLNVSVLNYHAIALYSKLGFRELGIIEKYYPEIQGSPYYCGEGRNAMIMVTERII